MKILIVPDSFKGSLSSAEVCTAIAKGLRKADNACEITALPFSDGGEGFTENLVNLCNGKLLYTNAHNIYHRPMEASIGVLGDTAVIDCATASGLMTQKRVMSASSFGTGELINFAVSRGFNKIILGLGGSGCCDGGAGALAALGAVFYDINYSKITVPKGQDLNEIYGASFRNIVKGIDFTFACDVENPYFGKNGAAYVFAPQKGANKTQVEELDEGLKRLNAFLPRDIGNITGSGAAGGICGGLYAVYGGRIMSGFDVLAEYTDLEKKVQNADVIITGEGKTDAQTLMGKLPYRIACLAEKYQKPCVVISGHIDGVTLGNRMLSLTEDATPAEYAIAHAAELLEEKANTSCNKVVLNI